MTRYRSARCILVSKGRYLLAQHNNYLPETIGKWGLPGGKLDEGESPAEAARREIEEEFGITGLGEVTEIGDWEYRGAMHKVFSVGIPEDDLQDLIYDQNEILDIKWCAFDEVQKMHHDGKLHTGFELPAITRYLNLQA